MGLLRGVIPCTTKKEVGQKSSNSRYAPMLSTASRQGRAWFTLRFSTAQRLYEVFALCQWQLSSAGADGSQS